MADFTPSRKPLHSRQLSTPEPFLRSPDRIVTRDIDAPPGLNAIMTTTHSPESLTHHHTLRPSFSGSNLTSAFSIPHHLHSTVRSPSIPLVSTPSDNGHESNMKVAGFQSQSQILAHSLSLPHHDLSDGHSFSNDPGVVEPSIADRKRFEAWMTCFCVVGFDLELGQALEYVYPLVNFSDAEKRTIRFNAFPDSNSFAEGDITFSFNIRRIAASATPQQSKSQRVSSSGSTSVPNMDIDDDYLYAVSFFRQQPDSTIRRGYYQKSVVIVSHLPLIGLWERVIRIVGPLLFELGLPALETAVNNIAKWPTPTSGMQELPLLGSALQVHLPPLPPNFATLQLLPTSAKNLGSFHVLAMTFPNALYPTFRDLIDTLWTLWEIVILNEPIAVLSSCPTVCSRAVEALAALIRPIPIDRTYRPYLTIQDPDFHYFILNHPPPRTILGVTNPHFHSALDRWPHVLQIGPTRTTPGQSKITNPSSFDVVQGLTTKHKRVVARDQTLLNQVASMSLEGAPDVLIENSIRRHFGDLTEQFLAPLYKYLATLWPKHVSLTLPYPVQPQPFQAEAFFASLCPTSNTPLAAASVAPPIPVRSLATRWLSTGNEDWVELYRAFLRTPQCIRWIANRIDLDTQRWADQYIALACSTDLTVWWASVYGGPTGRASATGGKVGGRRSAVAEAEAAALRSRIDFLLNADNPHPPTPIQAARLNAQLVTLQKLNSRE